MKIYFLSLSYKANIGVMYEYVHVYDNITKYCFAYYTIDNYLNKIDCFQMENIYKNNIFSYDKIIARYENSIMLFQSTDENEFTEYINQYKIIKAL